MQEKGTISIHTENIFPIIKKFLYSDHEIFLRELVSNAVDATQKLKKMAALGEVSTDIGNDFTIEITVNKGANTITVSDKGIGMTAEEIKRYINQIAFSGAAEFLGKYKDKDSKTDIIGHFGLGFYSSFMVADKVEINSRSYQDATDASHWECDGSTGFELSLAKKKQRGTDVILHVNEDSKEFLEDHRIQGILDKYCRFLPVPIKFGMRDDSVEDGKDKDGNTQYKTVKVNNIVNETEPLWVKAPVDISDEDYLDFYKKLYPFSADPLFWIHLNVDYPFNLTGILYFPKIKKDIEIQKNKIQLYSRQVFITDEVKDIVPEFLMLLHGVLDSPDIPLNVSRSYLQSDNNVKKINAHITKKVADKLEELFKKDRSIYEQKWDDIGVFVKYGMISDEKFYDKAKKFALLKSVEKEYFTLDEYQHKVETNQKDKDKSTVYLYSTDHATQDSFIQAAKKKSYHVLLMDGPLDPHFISSLERKLDKTQIKRVDADVVDKLIDKNEKKESVLSNDDQNKVKEIFEKAINDKNMTVAVESMAMDELPVTITVPEFMRRMKDMQTMGGGGMMMMGDMPDQYSVSINANHQLTSKILSQETQEEQQELAKHAFDIAKLSQNLLTGTDLTNFLERSVHLIASKE